MMTRCLLGLLWGCLVLPCLAQGTLRFANRIPGLVDARVLIAAGAETVPADERFVLQLYAAAPGRVLQAVSQPMAFREQGYLPDGGSVEVPGVPAGSPAQAKLVAWAAALGRSYEQARAFGNGWFGESEVVTVITGDAEPAALVGLAGFGIAVDMGGPFTSRFPPSPDAAPVWWSANGHYYQRVEAQGIEWIAARLSAEARSYRGLSGHLLTLGTAEEAAFVLAQPELDWLGNAQADRCWIGANRPAGTAGPAIGWQWVTGESMAFTQWAANEPSESTLRESAAWFTNRVANGTREWSDVPPTLPAARGFLVEYEEARPAGANWGTLDFRTKVTGQVDARVFYSHQGNPIPADGRFLAQLYAGAAGDVLQPVGAPVAFLDSPAAGQGYLTTGGNVSVPGVAAGSPARVKMVAWAWELGASYEEAKARGRGDVGESAAITVATGGGLMPPTYLVGLQGFSISSIAAECSPSPCALPLHPNPPPVRSASGHVYQRVEAPGITWAAARADAESRTFEGMPGHLVTITSDAESALLYLRPEFDWFGTNAPLARYWIGAWQAPGSPEPTGGWQWVGGERFDFSRWAAGQPDDLPSGASAAWLGDVVSGGRRLWADVSPTDVTARGFVVEYWTDIPQLVTNSVVRTLVAGSGRSEWADGTGIDASFYGANGVAVDRNGNVFVADSKNARIRKITPDGVVSTLAGAAAGYADGPLAASRFTFPADLCFDATGNLFVVEMFDHRVRRIGAEGIVSTVAGNGIAGYADGPGPSARFNQPSGVVADAAGWVYVADSGNHAIRRIGPDGTVTTWIGNGTAGDADGPRLDARLSRPERLAVDSAGNLFIAETSAGRIRKLEAATGRVTTLVGHNGLGYRDGPVAEARLNGGGSPMVLSVDPSGNLWIGDNGNQAVRRLSPAGWVETVYSPLYVSGLAAVSDRVVWAMTAVQLHRLELDPEPASAVEVTLVGTCRTVGVGTATGVTVAEGHAYLADWTSGLQIIDLADPGNPRWVGGYDTIGPASGVAISGHYAYVADGAGGLVVFDVTDAASPRWVGQAATFGYAYGIVIRGQYSYVAANESGLLVFDLTDPVHPRLIGSCDTSGSAMRVAVSGDYACVADYEGGLQVIRIANPLSPLRVGGYTTGGVVRSVAVYGDYVLVADGSVGLDVIELSNPTQPRRIGRCEIPGGASGVAAYGGYAFVSTWASGLGVEVISLKDPAHPRRLGGFAGQGIMDLTAADGYLYLASRSAGLQILRVSPAGAGEPPVITSQPQDRSVNGSFEFPQVPVNQGGWFTPGQAQVPGWRTTEPDGLIELWDGGRMGVPAFAGSQFAEVNAYERAALFQDLTAVGRGAQIGFEFAHRGRTGSETLALVITDLGSDGRPDGGDDRLLFRREYTSDGGRWSWYTSREEPPIVALGHVLRVAFESQLEGSVGNLLDAVDFGPGVAGALPTNAPPVIFVQPMDLDLAAGDSESLRVVAAGGPPVGLHWQRIGAAVPTPDLESPILPLSNVQPADAGRYFVVVTNRWGSVTSRVATVTVASTPRPRIASAGSHHDPSHVILAFSTAVEPASATNPANYRIGGGHPIHGVEQLAPDTVRLRTSLPAPGWYEVIVSGVRADAPEHPPILRDTRALFALTDGQVNWSVFDGINADATPETLLDDTRIRHGWWSRAGLTSDFEFPTDDRGAAQLGQLRAFLHPPVTGAYRFWFWADDRGLLLLSPDEDPANRRVIARVDAPLGFRAYTVASEPILLEQGRRYYLEALYAETDDLDGLGVAWQLPGAPPPAVGDLPIGSDFVSSLQPPGAPLVVPRRVATLPAEVGQPLTLDVNESDLAGSPPLALQWLWRGNPVPGATKRSLTVPWIAPTDDGAEIELVVTNVFGATRRTIALLSTRADPMPPEVEWVEADALPDRVSVRFSEAVDEASATNLGRYTLTGGPTLLSATREPDGRTVMLRTPPMSPSSDLVLTVREIADLEGHAMAAEQRFAFPARLELVGQVAREIWLAKRIGRFVGSLADLPAFQSDRPMRREIWRGAETPANTSDHYGQRLSGWLVPEVSGDYRFAVAADECAEFRVSGDDDPANLEPVARVERPTGQREWTRYPTQTSAPRALEAGRWYAFEALMAEGVGTDHLSLGWVRPGAGEAEVIAESALRLRLDPRDRQPKILRQPESCTVWQQTGGGFRIVAVPGAYAPGPLRYQWQRDGIDVPDATEADYLLPVPLDPATASGTRYRCVVIDAAGGAVVSEEVSLTVLPQARAVALTLTVQGASLVLTWPGEAGVRLQRATRLQRPDWQDVPGTSGASRFETAFTAETACFRLVRSP